MKISLVVDCRRINWTGVGTYLKNLLPFLVKCEEIKVICLGKNDELNRFKWFSQINCVELTSKIFSVREQFEFFSKIPKCDLFWAPHNTTIPLCYRGRLLITVHDVLFLALPQYLKGVHRKLYSNIMYSAVKRKADAIICVSEFTEHELVRLLEIERSKIHIIHLGINGSWFYPQKDISPHAMPYLLCIGNVKQHKNIGNLIKAFKIIMNMIPHDLVIVGNKKGLISSDKSVLAKDSSLDGRVKFVGYVGDQVLRQYYSSADALVFPSLYEGFGFPPLEAMSCGCPVIVSNAASLPEVCGDAVLYCNPYSPEDIAIKIKKILYEVSLRETLKQKGLKHAKQFTWQKCAMETLQVIKKFSQP